MKIRMQPNNVGVSPAFDPEIISYREERLKRLGPIATTHTPSGQILDWIPIEAQISHGKIATPLIATPPFTHKERRRVASPTAMSISFEMEDPRLQQGPDGTVPVLRRCSHYALRNVRRAGNKSSAMPAFACLAAGQASLVHRF
jgi:hypothetical protein